MILSVILKPPGCPETFSRCLASVCAQSMKDIEFLCPTRGLSPSSLEILMQHTAEDTRIRPLPDIGVELDNRELFSALCSATGEYVHVLFGEDTVLDYAYEAVVNKLKRYDLDCLKFCSVEWDDSQNCSVRNPEYTYERLQPGDFNRILDRTAGSALYQLNPALWSGIVRRSLMQELIGDVPDSTVDFEQLFHARLLSGPRRIAVSRDTLLIHHRNRSRDEQFLTADLHCRMETIRRIESSLLQAGTEPTCFEAVMIKEFRELLRRCRYLPEDGSADALADLREFLDEFNWAFMRSILKKAAQLVPGQQPSPPRRTVFFHDTCPSPKVSVVVPIFNQEEYLNQALYSLSVQTLPELEFICVNDGSTDASMTILQEYAAVDHRIRIIDKPNSGYGHSMNVGINAATGEYLGILEPDDFVPPEMFGALYTRAKEQNLDMIKADFYRFSVLSNGHIVPQLTRLTTDSSFYSRIICPLNEPETFWFVINTWSGIYRLDFLNRWNIRHHETPGASYQDNGFWFQTFCRAERAWFEPQAFYMYRKDNPNSSIFSNDKFYTLTREYDFIHDWLEKDPELLEHVEPIYYQRKLHALLLNYYRLAPALKKNYLALICDEFRSPLQEGKLPEGSVGATDRKLLREIMADPERFENQIRISAILPVYNCAAHLRECLDSILIRSEINFDLLCIDNGSTDGSAEILREFEAKDPRVHVFTQEHTCTGSAKNTGIRHALGEYLIFLDTDAFFEPDMLRKLYLKAYTEESDVVVFRSDEYNQLEERFGDRLQTFRSALLPDRRPFAGRDIPKDLFSAFNGHTNTILLDKLFRTEFIRSKGLEFQEIPASDDLLFVFSALIQADRISVMSQNFVHHRQPDTDHKLSAAQSDHWDSFYKALLALRSQLQKRELFDRYERDFVNFALQMSISRLHAMREPQYSMLFNSLKDAWFEELGINGRNALYFYNEEQYCQYTLILESDATKYLFERLNCTDQSLKASSSEKKELEKQLKEISLQKKDLEVRSKELVRNKKDLEMQVKDWMKQEKRWNKQEKDLKKQNTALEETTKTLQSKLNQKEHEINAVNNSLQKAKKENAQLRSSRSYRIGRAITLIPRKIRRLFRSVVHRSNSI